MEGIELRARRVAFGLSVAEAARLLDVNEKHWRDWEAGRRPVPVGVAESMLEFSETVLDGIDAAVEAAERAIEETGQPPMIFAYKTIEAFERAGGEAKYGVPWSGHTAIAGLTLLACQLNGIDTRLRGIHHADAMLSELEKDWEHERNK